MRFKEIIPDTRLKQYVKCYYVYESGSAAAFDDTVFPCGCMEIIFNLGTGHWQTAAGGDDSYATTPPIELWGQITQPLPIRSIGQNIMLGIRFLPHGAAAFLQEKADLFNNQVVDYRDIAGKSVTDLHQKLLNAPTEAKRISLIETFLLEKLIRSKKQPERLAVIHNIMHELRQKDFFDNIDNVASRHGISSRYLQKLFLQYTGLTPKLYSKITRFQHSLRLVTKKESPLTSIAYDCGYFDQSHFIREFKSFTGLTPSGYTLETSPITVASAAQ